MYNIYYAKINKETLCIDGFYLPDIHGHETCENVIKECGIMMNEPLHQYLLTGEFKLKTLEGLDPELVYDLTDKELFEEVVREAEPVDPTPTTEDRVEMLEEENALLLMDSAKKDAVIKSLENDVADLMLEVAMIRRLSEV